MRKHATIFLRSNRLNDFKIIDWNIAGGNNINKEDINTDNVGEFMSNVIKKSGIANDWGVMGLSYDYSELKSGVIKHSFQVHFDGDPMDFENPLHLFGLDGETRVSWL